MHCQDEFLVSKNFHSKSFAELVVNFSLCLQTLENRLEE